MSRPHLVLRVTDDGRAPAELPQQGKLVIGSSEERADFVVSGQGVSEVHCAIGRVKGGGWALKDLGSEFGTLLNGERVEAARLTRGDVIVIGARRLEIVDPTGAAGPPRRPAEASERVVQPPSVTAPPPVPATPSSPRTVPSRTAKGPPTIPGYRIEREIGRGGTGSVWLAVQESLDRKVAMKILSPRLAADATFVGRFQNEARSVAALTHPNVVTVHDVGESQGLHFLTMEFMAGGCLESRLAALGPLNWREAVKVLLDAARGLEFAESRGIVHQDIKPANLMQTADGITKLADLGLAAPAETLAEGGGGKKVRGTPHFLAPEVIRGGAAGTRSDLYSLGVTAYRLLSAETPFEGPNVQAILKQVLRGEPDLLGDRVPGLPRGVEELVHDLMALDPGARPPNAGVVVARLEALDRGQTLGGASLAAAPASKPRVGLILAGISALVIAGFGVKVLLNGDSGPPASPGGTGTAGVGADPNGSKTQDPGDDTPIELSGPGAGQQGGNGVNNGSALTEDEQEKELEEKAELAYLRLQNEALSDEDRVLRLRALAEEYRGTTISTKSREEAAALAEVLATVGAEEAEHTAAREAILDALRSAADLESEPPRPGEALRNLRSVPGQEQWAGDESFVTARRRLEQLVLERGRSFAEAALDTANAQQETGDFDGMLETLNEFLGTVDFPDWPEGGEPEAVLRVRELAQAARQRIARVDALRAQFIAQAEKLDRARLSDGLVGAGGLEGDLRAMALGAVEERLTLLLGRLSTVAGRARLEPLVTDARLMRAAHRRLVDEGSAGRWRRRSVLVPRGSGRTDPSEVVTVSMTGMTLEDGSKLAWGQLGAHPRSLANLFKERIEGDYTEDERAGIAALTRVAAVLNAIDLCSPSLAGASDAFGRDERESLLAGFAEAADWADEGPAQRAQDREHNAAVVLADALDAVNAARWGDAEVLLERLIREHQESLLVMLLSDGGV